MKHQILMVTALMVGFSSTAFAEVTNFACVDQGNKVKVEGSVDTVAGILTYSVTNDPMGVAHHPKKDFRRDGEGTFDGLVTATFGRYKGEALLMKIGDLPAGGRFLPGDTFFPTLETYTQAEGHFKTYKPWCTVKP